jgi:(hydroxyamino)benzene mutase
MTYLQKKLSFAGSFLMFLGFLTGALVSAAITHQINADGAFMLASHLNALMGCFWCMGVAWTVPSLALSAQRVSLLTTLVIIATYANWGVTLVKAFLKVQGITFLGETYNDLIFVSLTLSVVIPSVLAGGLWAWGCWKSWREAMISEGSGAV